MAYRSHQKIIPPNQGNDQRQAFVQQTAQQEYKLAREMAGNSIDLNEVLANLSKTNLPIPLHQVPFIANLTAANTPVLLIPKNTNRCGFIIGNPTAITIFFSYGYPIATGSAGGPLGLPITTFQPFQEANGTVTIDDIYIFATQTALAYPFSIIGYEGLQAFENA